MQNNKIKHNFLILLVLLSAISEVCLEQLEGAPERPKIFRSKHELVEYINKINNYYGVVGRPRFGKRVPKNRGLNEMENDSKQDSLNNMPSNFVLGSLFRKKVKKNDLE